MRKGGAGPIRSFDLYTIPGSWGKLHFLDCILQKTPAGHANNLLSLKLCKVLCKDERVVGVSLKCLLMGCQAFAPITQHLLAELCRCSRHEESEGLGFCSPGFDSPLSHGNSVEEWDW